MKHLLLLVAFLVAPSVTAQVQEPCTSVILPRKVATDLLKAVTEEKHPMKNLLSMRQSLLGPLEHRVIVPCRDKEAKAIDTTDVAINFGNLQVLENWRKQLRSGRIDGQVLCQLCARIKLALGYADKATVTKGNQLKAVDIQCPGRISMLRSKVSRQDYLA